MRQQHGREPVFSLDAVDAAQMNSMQKKAIGRKGLGVQGSGFQGLGLWTWEESAGRRRMNGARAARANTVF